MPASFAALRETAEREGYDFLRRLGDRWDGERYLSDELATVWGAVADGELVAIGAQTYDEYDPSPLHRRIRHFYVRPDRRRGGLGRVVARCLITDAHALAPLLHLRATHALSTAFWDRVGFARVDGREDRTHVLACR
ncbi:MAG: GNAT family N-acetyltransferase [Hyphomonadaceae bacterium]